jgi:FtsH ternary system domain X6
VTTTTQALPQVSPNGRDLLLVARALVRGGPYEEIESILVGETRMAGVAAGTMRLFEETLARGGVHALARLGGWRRRARPTPQGVAVGRLWEVRLDPPLAFSAYPYELCQWLVAQPLGTDGGEALRATPSLPGDELLAYLACALVEGQPLEGRVAEQPGVRASALAWLGFPGMLGRVAGRAPQRPAFDTLVRQGAVVLEALVDDLARRAVAYERAKADLTSTSAVSRLGEARDRALGFLLDALEQADRWDLATFLVDAATTLLPRALSGAAAAAQLVSTLDPRTSLADRAAALRGSAAHLRHLGRLARHHEALRQARHFDEGYAQAQLLLSRWEALGTDGFARAADALAQFTALDRG